MLDSSDELRISKGPIRLTTYISLTCENCPEVVQALNQMALLHSDFQHEMRDGGFVPGEIEQLGIQRCTQCSGKWKTPSLRKNRNDRFTFQARRNFWQIKSSAHASPSAASLDLGHFDMVVVGGGPAGVTAAIYSARKGLKTAILAEKIGGQLQETKGIENFISIPYTEGPQLSAQLAQHLATYPVQIFEQRRVKKIGTESKKVLELEGGEKMTADKVIITTGAKWRELGIPGEKDYRTRSCFLPSFRRWPLYKGKKIAVIGGGNSGVEAAIDLAGIVKEIVVFEFQPQLKADQILIDKLKAFPHVSIVTNAKTSQVLGDGQKVNGLEYVDRTSGKPEKLI